MDPLILASILRSSPVYGPIIVALIIALVHQTKELKKSQDARIADAKRVTDTLVSVNSSTTLALTGIEGAIDALSDRVSETSLPPPKKRTTR